MNPIFQRTHLASLLPATRVSNSMVGTKAKRKKDTGTKKRASFQRPKSKRGRQSLKEYQGDETGEEMV